MLLFWTIPLQAQEYMFKKLDYKDGLSNGQINVIHKDKEGYMWFGTASGLNRFNGYNFKLFRYSSKNPNSIPDDFIQDIVETHDGNLWVRTDKGWTLYDHRREMFINDLKATLKQRQIYFTPSRIYIDSNFNEWYYDYGKKLCKYAPRQRKTATFSLKNYCRLYGDISSISEAKENILLQFTSGLLMAIDKTTLQTKWKNETIHKFFNGKEREIMNLFVDSQGTIWIYGALGVWLCTSDGQQCMPLNQSIYKLTLNDQLHAIEEDGKGNIWLGTDKSGILILDLRSRQTTQRITAVPEDPRGLADNTIQSLYKDKEGIMWLGTYKQGVQYFQESIFKFHLYPVGDINCIEEADGQGLWLGTNGNGLLLWQPDGKNTRHFTHEKDGLGSNTIVCLLKDSQSRLWLGSYYGGLDCIDKGKVIHYRQEYGNPNSLSSNNVWSLAEDEKGNIYIATLGGGLQCLNPETGEFRTYTTANSNIFSNYLHKVVRGEDGHSMLIGSASNGLSIFDCDKHTFTNLPLRQNNTQVALNVVDMCVDSRGLVWVGTRDGLILFNPQTGELASLPDSIPYIHDFISAVSEGEDNSIWVTSSKYMVNIVPTPANNEDGYTFSFHTYDENDGLSNVFNQRSIKRLSSGSIIVGGFYGINVLASKKIHFNQHIPNVLFTGLLLDNKLIQVQQEYKGKVILEEALNISRKLKLAHTQDGFSLQLATDDYILPGKTRFIYKLEGADSDWQLTEEGVNRITYAHVGSGSYTLKVKAVNNDGIEGPVATLKITVLPPFYLSVWACLLYTMLALASLWYIRRRIIRREQMKLHLLAVEKEAEHTKKTDEIKTRFFTNISHELRTPLTLIISPLEMLMKEAENTPRYEKLSLIHKNAQRLLNMVNQLLDFKKSATTGLTKNMIQGDIIAYIQSVCEMFKSLSERKNVHLTFFSGIEHLYMEFDPDKITQIINNLLANAFKFTVAGERVDVSLEEIKENNQRLLEIKVSDTGIGISEKDKAHIFDRFYQVDNPGMNPSGSGIGLSLVKDYVTLHNGTIHVFDNIGKGCVFVINLPIMSKEKTELKAETPRAEKDDSKHPLLFIIDDNLELRTFLKESLSPDFKVNDYESAEEALGALEKGYKPKLILCDILLNQMDGFHFCNAVKKNSNWKDIPIILLSALQSNENKIKGLSLGAADYVTKPFNMDILKLKCHKLIETYRASQKQLLEPEPSHVAIASADEELVKRATAYVESHISEPEYSVEILSKEMGMSRVKLYKSLLRLTGKSPVEFIRLIRIKRAAQLLKDSQMTISEIAYQTGFNYPKYFAKYFKEQYDVSPSVYRERESQKL